MFVFSIKIIQSCCLFIKNNFDIVYSCKYKQLGHFRNLQMTSKSFQKFVIFSMQKTKLNDCDNSMTVTIR